MTTRREANVHVIFYLSSTLAGHED